MTAPVDREFAVLPRGHVREKVVLANWRSGLRNLINPETGNAFSEDEIQRATQTKSRWWIEAEAVDLFAQSEQRGALYLADQVRLERANTRFLEGFHAPLWAPEGKLPATGGSGTVSVPAVPGTIVLGSTTPGDAAAYKARDGSGKRYQVLLTTVTPAGGVATVTMIGLDTGSDTNPELGTKLTWINRDPNMQPEATVAADFSGGTDKENDADFSSRMLGTIRHKQAAGNDAHIRAWLRGSSNAIEEGYVYPCALHAGSILCAITQKRANVKGPLARIPSTGTLAAAIAAVTPPNSPKVPTPPFVAVLAPVDESSDLVLRLALARGAASGFTDATPFPAYHATTPAVTNVISPTSFDMLCSGDATLPGQAALATLSGANAPSLMVWDEDDSEFEELAVSSVEDLGANSYRVVLSAPATFTIANGDVISPDIGRRALIAQAIVDYFDELGPGNLFDVDTDPRGARCLRFPRTSEERPFKAGAVVATRVMDSLGGAHADALLASISATEPTYPTDLMTGPRMLVCGTVGVYL